MRVIPTAIPGVLEFEPKIFGDDRGYFFESFRQDIFEQHVGKVNFVQDNESKSGGGVLRGLHFQRPPYTQSKLVRVVSGSVLDVAVDLRFGSPTYGMHVSCRLDAERKNMLWIPKGFAHGFLVLSPEAIFTYKCDNYYSPAHDAGVFWADTSLAVDWCLPKEEIRVSQKDASLPKFGEDIVFRYEDYQHHYLYPKIS